jgi:hypothetical protein
VYPAASGAQAASTLPILNQLSGTRSVESLPLPIPAAIQRRGDPSSASSPQPEQAALPLPPLLRSPVAVDQGNSAVDIDSVANLGPTIQRALDLDGEGAMSEVLYEAQSEQQSSEPDLDQLARQVYPFIKRLLAVERERRLFR